MKKTPALDQSLQQLERWLAKNRSTFIRSLAPGAKPDEIAECERRIAMPLPDDLRTLLAWRNGQGEESQGYFEESWLLMGTEWIADAKTELDAQAGEIHWPTAWIPFLDNDQGDYLCLDTSKPETPVCAFWLGTKDRPVVADSLAAWMAGFVDALDRGTYVEDQERGRLIRTDSE